MQKITRLKFKEKIGKKKFLRLPLGAISGSLALKKRLFFRLIKEYLFLTKINNNFQLEIENCENCEKLNIENYNSLEFQTLLNYQTKVEQYFNAENFCEIYDQIKANKLSKILEINKIFRVINYDLIFKDNVFLTEVSGRILSGRFMKSPYIKYGPLAGLANENYKPYRVNYRKMLGKKKRYIRRKHYGSFMREKCKAIITTQYIGQFLKPGTSEKSLMKEKKIKLSKALFALKRNLRIPLKYKRVLKYKKKVKNLIKMRYSRLQIPELSSWSEKMAQQLNGEY